METIWLWIGYEFLTGYLIERSLSVDNIFVFVLIFTLSRCRPCEPKEVS